ncbi:MAG TPA: hypothetical protein GXZ35_02535 [Acholeplasmataceae bacterium]|nr:hypothetical protein [Acholeplasmataceae bacterium]
MLLLVLISMVTLVGCFALEPDTEITFVTLPKSTYLTTDDINEAKNDIVVQVKSSSGTFVMNLNSSELTVTGLDFSTPGQKTLTIAYGTVSINYYYLVVDDNTSNQDEADISWYTANPHATTFRLYDVADMLGFAQIVNGIKIGETTYKDNFENKTVLLMADIDLSETVWVPIGEGPREHLFVGGDQLYATPNEELYTGLEASIGDPDIFKASSVKVGGFFMGTFDGQNHKIIGLSDFGYVPAASEYQSSAFGGVINGATFGLFGRVSNATLKNIQFEDVNITGFAAYNTDTQTDLFAENDGVAALAGYSWGNLEVENVHVLSGSIEASAAVGAIVGRAYGYAEVKHLKQYTGYNYGEENFTISMTNCSNAANLTANTNHIAHLIGYTHVKKDSLNYSDCIGTGSLTLEGNTLEKTNDYADNLFIKFSEPINVK